MNRWISEPSDRRAQSLFSHFLRTGRIAPPESPADVEVKFNPWHDPDDGRFTFEGQGRYYPAGSRVGAEDKSSRSAPKTGAAPASKKKAGDRPATRHWDGGGFTG